MNNFGSRFAPNVFIFLKIDRIPSLFISHLTLFIQEVE